MQLTLDELKGLVEITGLDHRRKNAYGVCPSCRQDEFGISLEDGHRFGCFRKKKCGFNGNIFTLLRFLGKEINDIIPNFVPRARLEGKLMIDEEEVELDLSLPNENMPVGWKRIDHHPYLEARGFRAQDYDKFNVGATKIDSRFLTHWIVFGIHQDGMNKAYIGRSTKTKDEIERINDNYKKKGLATKELRYKNSSSDFSKILLGIEECTENTHTVILVEGLFDKQSVDAKLHLEEQEEVKCCCSFKCGTSDEQIALLQRQGVLYVVLMYDPDVIEEIKKAAWKLERYFKVDIAFNSEGKDPGDMTVEDFERVLSEVQSPTQFASSKLDVPELRKK